MATLYLSPHSFHHYSPSSRRQFQASKGDNEGAKGCVFEGFNGGREQSKGEQLWSLFLHHFSFFLFWISIETLCNLVLSWGIQARFLISVHFGSDLLNSSLLRLCFFEPLGTDNSSGQNELGLLCIALFISGLNAWLPFSDSVMLNAFCSQEIIIAKCWWIEIICSLVFFNFG